MNDNNMDFDILKPLIEHTFKKAIKNTPKEMEDIKKEYNIIEKHLKVNENHDLKILIKLTNPYNKYI